MALGIDGQRLIKGYDRIPSSPFSNPKPHLTAYQDSGGVWTIGWGHTGSDVYEGQTISQQQADLLFTQDVKQKAERFVDRFITIRLSQKQRDALISFTYNAGSGSLQKSVIRQLINKNNHTAAANEWLTQNIENRLGQEQSGLRLRRQQEAALYLEGTSEDQMSQRQADNLQEPIEEKNLESQAHIVPYTHSRGSEQMTVDELLNSKKFITSELTKKEVIELTFKGKTNHKRLFEALSKQEKRSLNNGSDQYNDKIDYPIISGATIYLSSEKIQIEITYQSNITTQNVNYNEYWPNIIKSITNDPGYVPAYEKSSNASRSIHPQLSVVVWSRVKYIENGFTGGFIDITKHVSSVNTESSVQVGGNFTMQMGNVVGEMNEDLKWESVGDLGAAVIGNINKSVTIDSQFNEHQRNHSIYEKLIQQNDLVFISYEKLKVEDDTSVAKLLGERKNGWFDMIGLVDSVDVITDSVRNDVDVNIRGRDLVKALMDDNSYFNPYSIGHIDSLYGGNIGDRYFNGEFKNLAAFLATSIRQKVEYIIHRIASIGYVPDNVFDEFISKTEITEITTGVQSEKSVKETKPAKGIWQICKVFIDQSISDMRLADDSISNPDGSIIDTFNKVAQYPFVEFMSDTYKDKFYLIFRRPPFTQQALDEVILGYNQQQASQQEEVKSSPESDRVQDDESDNAKEPLLMLPQIELSDNNFPIAVNISEVDVLSDNLHTSNEAYAWYQIENRGNFSGNTVTLGHMPSIYFDEYAQVFGNRRMSIVSNYSDYKFFEHKDGQKDQDLYAEQGSQQLAYLVEISMYLPFTRQGTITMNGDRRIKKGNWIFYRPTQEFFYVTQVTNNISISTETIDRTTTIQVERGMLQKYLLGSTETIDGEEVDISYFNIVDIPKFKQGVYDTVTKGVAEDKFDYKADIAINKKVFNFFLQRRHFK